MHNENIHQRFTCRIFRSDEDVLRLTGRSGEVQRAVFECRTIHDIMPLLSKITFRVRVVLLLSYFYIYFCHTLVQLVGLQCNKGSISLEIMAKRTSEPALHNQMSCEKFMYTFMNVANKLNSKSNNINSTILPLGGSSLLPPPPLRASHQSFWRLIPYSRTEAKQGHR